MRDYILDQFHLDGELLEEVYFQYHLLAYYYNWTRHDIKSLPSKERTMWAKRIVEHENRKNGGGEEET